MWSYSGNPDNSPLDRGRFIIQDTYEDDPMFQDEEIEYLLQGQDPKDNIQLELKLFQAAVTRFTRFAIKRSLGPQSEDPTARLKYYWDRMEELKQMAYAAGVSIPKYAFPKVFRKGMFNNPKASIPVGGDYIV